MWENIQITKVRRDKGNIARGVADNQPMNQPKGRMSHFMSQIRKWKLNGWTKNIMTQTDTGRNLTKHVILELWNKFSMHNQINK